MSEKSYDEDLQKEIKESYDKLKNNADENYNNKNYKEAIENYDEALALVEPNSQEYIICHNNIAQCYINLNNCANATKHAKLVIEKEKNNEKALERIKFCKRKIIFDSHKFSLSSPERFFKHSEEDMKNLEVKFIEVKKSTQLGNGVFKNAFTIVKDMTNNPHNFTIPAGSDVANFCLVEYAVAINWKKESTFRKLFIEFRNNIKKFPQLKYDIEHKILDPHMKLSFDEKTYEQHRYQFNCIAELKKMYELAPRFAPKLHQIRIDSSTTLGTPFSPDEMDLHFAEIPSGPITISYLIERCGDSIIKYVSKNQEERRDEVAQKMIEFVDSYVDRHIELNTDTKPENFCTQIVDGKIELIRMLDVDPKYSTICIDGGNIEEFKRHAKVFMKYAFITYSIRWGEKIDGTRMQIDFGNLGVTQDDLDAMLTFFYKKKYMIQDFNPINILYHYFIQLHPSEFKLDHLTEYDKMYLVPERYEFLYYDSLMNHFNINKLIEIFKKYNEQYKITLTQATKTKGGSRRKRKSARKHKSKQRTKSRRH